MRILHVADIHYRLDWFEWISQQSSNYDVLVVAGDLLNMFPCENTPLERQAHVVRDWLKTLLKPAVVCTGNHDTWMTDLRGPMDAFAEGGWLQLCKRTGIIVDGQDAEIHGERFAAVKWGGSDWPGRASIVVCHAPPSETRVSMNAEGEDVGDFEVMMRVHEKHPKYVLSGHVHDPMDWMTLEGVSYCFNPGCDCEAREPNHIIIDTTKKIACWNSMGQGLVSRCLDGERRQDEQATK